MKTNFFNLKTILGVILVCILLLNVFFIHSIILGIVCLILYSILLSLHIYQITKNDIAGPIILITTTIVVNTSSYYIYGTTKLTASFIILSSLLFFIIKREKANSEQFKKILERMNLWIQQKFIPFAQTKEVLLATLIICLDTFLLYFIWTRRTVDLMPSPWEAINSEFFLAFTITTILLIYTIIISSAKKISFVILSLHLFVMYSVAPLLYPLGYGFDAFIHRATENWIFQHGFINPKQPYYIGQYSVIVFLSHITGLSIQLIDVYLVPVLASILIPITVSRSYAKKFKIKKKHALLNILAIAFIPFFSFHLTTPHNLVMILSLLAVFTTILYQKNGKGWYIPLLLTLAALVTHPLIGTPILLFFLTAIFVRQTKKRNYKLILLTISTIVQTLLLPILFTLNNVRTGHGLPTLNNPLLTINLFFELFARPYWYLRNAPIFWEFVYAWERLIVPIVILIAISGFFVYKKRTTEDYLYPLTAFGMFLSAWLLRSWITFPDVVAYEQGDYPMRIIRASILFLLPWFLYGLFRIARLLYTKHNRYWRLILVTVSALALTISFYFSYPQKNIKSRFPGFNVTQTDFNAVKLIHDKNEMEKSFILTELTQEQNLETSDMTMPKNSIQKSDTEIDYIVLSNQLVSAASLTTYSFAKTFDTSLGKLFYYSIPTGGPLYQQYGNMLYKGQKREFIETAMDLAGVNTGYFVVNSYWANSDEIIKGAKKTSDSWWKVDGGKIFVFVYKK